MIKAKESQGLFDYNCKQTHKRVNGKFMNRKNIHQIVEINYKRFFIMTKLLLPNSKLLMNIFENEWKDISFKIETFMPQQVMKNFFWNCPHVRSYQVLFFYLGIATFTLTCQAKGGNAGTQLIPEEASLKCKSSNEAENKVSF